MADTDTTTNDTAANAGGDNAAAQVAKPADAPVYTKAQLTEKIAREVARVAQERDAHAAKLAEYEAEKEQERVAKLSATQRAEEERKRAEKATAEKIAALESRATQERAKRHETMRSHRAASVASTLVPHLWTPALAPEVERVIAERLVVVDDGKGGETVLVRMGAEGDNEPIETALPKLREDPRIASYFKINGGSGAQHGGGGSGARFDPMSGDPTDMIAQGLRSRRNT